MADALRDVFPPVTTEAWEDAAREELGGRDLASLAWDTGEGVTVAPFYRREDLEGLEVQAIVTARTTSGDVPADAIRADALHDAGATTVQQLAWALAEGVERLATATAAGTPVDEAARDVAFVFAAGPLYFVEIAKLRAARLLWSAVAAAFGSASPRAASARVHVRTGRIDKSRDDPYTNLLRVTTAAMSAVTGGADTVQVEPYGFEPHLATNVPRILVEEAHLDAVADPGAGSYYVERLTDAIAREAWALFQQIEAAGGHAAAVAAGMRDAHVAASRAVREHAVAVRDRTLVGVNDYPDLTGHAPPAVAWRDHDGDDTPGLEPVRLAAPFETLRQRTARHAATTGRTPRVHMLTRGDVGMRTARAGFCLNLFGCAGLNVSQGDALPDAADLVVICAADEEYPAIVADVMPHVAVPVLVAGRPAAARALIAAGVTGFVHRGIDVIEVLTEWQDRLGMAP